MCLKSQALQFFLYVCKSSKISNSQASVCDQSTIAAVSVEFHCLHRPTLEPGLQGLNSCRVRFNIQKSQLNKLTVVTCKLTFSRPIELYCSRTGSFNRLFTYYFQLLTNIFPLSGLHGGV